MKHKIYFLVTLVLVMLTSTISYASDYDGHWAKEEIQKALHQEIISLPDDQFFPDKEATATEMVNVMNAFMKKNGLLSSKESISIEQPNGYFSEKSENACITREELAIIVNKVLNLDITIDLEAKTTFNDDANITPWAKGYVANLQEKKIFIGYPDSSFKPENYITKAELVTVMNRCQDFLGQEVTFIENRDVSKIEIGILKYENGKAIVSPIHEEIKLKVGESVVLAVMMQDDTFEDDLCFEVENKDVANLDEATYTLEANSVGVTCIKFFGSQDTVLTSFDVIVE